MRSTRARSAAPANASSRCSSTPEPKPPASTFSSIVTSSSCSAASRSISASSSGFAKRASATVDREVVLGEERRRVERDPDPVAVAEQRHPLALLQHLAGADRDLAGAVGQRHALGGAARVAKRDRAVVVGERGAQHVAEHRLVARRHQRPRSGASGSRRRRRRRGGSGRRRRPARRGPSRRRR